MKSFRDEIDENLDNFTGPVSQAFRNIRDSISDSISDAVADRQAHGGKYATPKKKGCLWPIIKWILILSVVSAALSECSGGESTPVGDGVQSATQATNGIQLIKTQSANDAPESIDNVYELILVSTKSNIAAILDDDQPDMVELQSEYECLLFFKINEYMYKASAYGYYTGDYDSNQFADIMTECDAILLEMKEYFPENEVDEYFTVCSLMAYQSYDENNIDYDVCLIGNKNNPDVDAMWLNYVEALAKNTGWDIQNEVDAHGMDMYSALIPTESTEILDSKETSPTQSVADIESYIEAYVKYSIGGGLNIRSGPGVDNEKVGSLPEGEMVVIWETQYVGDTQWGHIDQGWISMDYIQFDVPIPPSDQGSNSESTETYETDFFYITLQAGWDNKYVLEHSYSARSEYLVFYYASEYAYYEGTYSEPGGWPFAIEIRADGTECSAIAGWEHIGSISIYEDSWYELYLHYPIDPQFMDGSYNSFLADARSIVNSIVAKDGYAIIIY